MNDKKKGHGNIYGSDIITPMGRAQYVWLSKVKANDFGSEDYTITVFWDKKDPTVKAGLEAILKASKDLHDKKWGDKKKFDPAKILIDGDKPQTKQDGTPRKVWEGFKGHYYRQFKCSAPNKPRIYDAKRQLMQPELIMPGMLVRVVYQPGISTNGAFFKLTGVQLIKDDGVRFLGRDPSELMEDMSSLENAENTAAVAEDGSPDMANALANI